MYVYESGVCLYGRGATLPLSWRQEVMSLDDNTTSRRVFEQRDSEREEGEIEGRQCLGRVWASGSYPC